MPTSSTLRRHADLVDRMATTVGVDFEQKMLEAQMEIDDITDAVLACTGCSNPDACEQWLVAQAGQADAPPDICRNIELFDRLKAGKHA